MKEYTVYFEFFEKKMKAKVFAKSEKGAKEAVAEKIIFHKIVDGKVDYKKMWDRIVNNYNPFK